VVTAILQKARQISSWPSLNAAADALSKAIYTNLSLTDLMFFSTRIDTTHAAHVGLSVANVLVYAESADGQSILLLADGNWSAIRQYVQQNLKP
jgi:anionic cell wall polymer biosynthesis LytR-Cps2A-Psr (LCP) family protein